MQCKGEKFEMMTSEVVQVRLDNDKVKEILTAAQLKECSKEVRFMQIKTVRYEGSKPKFKMPNFANATPEGLTDMLGEVREQIKDLQKLEGLYKEALTARLSAAESDAKAKA